MSIRRDLDELDEVKEDKLPMEKFVYNHDPVRELLESLADMMLCKGNPNGEKILEFLRHNHGLLDPVDAAHLIEEL